MKVRSKKEGKNKNKRWAIAIILIAALAVGYSILTKDGGPTSPSPQVVKGEKLYGTYCISCHGNKGVGENPKDIYATDEYGFVAPPLDESAHAWHHTDEGLVMMILDGSPRNPRMRAWKGVLTEEDAAALVEYIKSLWSPRIRKCQGPKHMECM